MSLRVFLLILIALAGPAQSQVAELDLSADYCSILRAFSLAETSACPPVDLGTARSLGSAASAAVPPGDPNEERGYFIRFAFNSKDLTPEYRDHLTRLGQVFHAPETQNLCFKLVGHTDGVGAATYNQILSEDRARTVQLFLVGVTGVAPDRLSLEGRGETALLPGIAASDGLNRRVEILARPMQNSSCLE